MASTTCGDIISINDRLPVEILCEIFSYANDLDLGWGPGLLGLIWGIRQVCSYWRHTANECPTLWQHFRMGCWMKVKTDTLKIRLKLAIKNSKSLPLSVYLATDDDYTRSENIKLLGDLYDMLFQDISVYRRLNKLHILSFKDRLLLSLPSSLLQFPEHEEKYNLEELDLRWVEFENGFGSPLFRSLRQVTLYGMNSIALHSLLSNVPKLEMLDIVECDDYTTEVAVTLPFLHTVKIKSELYSNDFHTIFTMIHAPSLTNLVLNTIADTELDYKPLANFIKRSKCIIKSLTLIGIFHDQLAIILSHFVAVEKLRLLDMFNIDKISNLQEVISILESGEHIHSVRELEVDVGSKIGEDDLMASLPTIVPKTAFMSSLRRFKLKMEKRFRGNDHRELMETTHFKSMKKICAERGVDFELV